MENGQRVFAAAAEADGVDPELTGFLLRLAEDEAWHYHMMGSAAELLREQEHAPRSAVFIDRETRSHVEGPLRDLKAKILDNRAGRKAILAAIVRSETSEWNDISRHHSHETGHSRLVKCPATIPASR